MPFSKWLNKRPTNESLLRPKDLQRILPYWKEGTVADHEYLLRAVPDAYLRSLRLDPQHWEMEVVLGSSDRPVLRNEFMKATTHMKLIQGNPDPQTWHRNLFHIRMTYCGPPGEAVPHLPSVEAEEAGDFESFVLPLPHVRKDPERYGGSRFPPHRDSLTKLSKPSYRVQVPNNHADLSGFFVALLEPLVSAGRVAPPPPLPSSSSSSAAAGIPLSTYQKVYSTWLRWPTFAHYNPFARLEERRPPGVTTGNKFVLTNLGLQKEKEEGWKVAGEAVQVVFLVPDVHTPGTREPGERVQTLV
ncbi:hypothetical protein JCM8547_008363 [Rhodosporidiobolus lusitaniae]